MRTFNYSEIQNTPVWNEVKNWSEDRKNALITLLYSTMNGINPYEAPEEKAQALKDSIYGPVTPEVPGSILRFHPDVTIIADEAAMSLIK